MTVKKTTHIMVTETIQRTITEITGVVALQIGIVIIDQEKISIIIEKERIVIIGEHRKIYQKSSNRNKDSANSNRTYQNHKSRTTKGQRQINQVQNNSELTTNFPGSETLKAPLLQLNHAHCNSSDDASDAETNT